MAVHRAVAILTLFATGVAAQHIGEIRGSISDWDNRPVIPSRVTLEASNGSVKVQQGQTEPGGVFHLVGLPPGEYAVTIQAPLFYTTSVKGGSEPRRHALFRGCDSRSPVQLIVWARIGRLSTVFRRSLLLRWAGLAASSQIPATRPWSTFWLLCLPWMAAPRAHSRPAQTAAFPLPD